MLLTNVGLKFHRENKRSSSASTQGWRNITTAAGHADMTTVLLVEETSTLALSSVMETNVSRDVLARNAKDKVVPLKRAWGWFGFLRSDGQSPLLRHTSKAPSTRASNTNPAASPTASLLAASLPLAQPLRCRRNVITCRSASAKPDAGSRLVFNAKNLQSVKPLFHYNRVPPNMCGRRHSSTVERPVMSLACDTSATTKVDVDDTPAARSVALRQTREHGVAFVAVSFVAEFQK